jgi:hypothetical protein
MEVFAHLGWTALARTGTCLAAGERAALGGGLLAALLAAALLFRSRSETSLNTNDMTLTDFAAHLRQRGVPLHVVPGARHGGPHHHGYLTEDPDATWAAMQHKFRIVECLHQWRGTVWVGDARLEPDAEGALAQWGEHGCRIGTFYLFGDDRVLRRIQAACR